MKVTIIPGFPEIEIVVGHSNQTIQERPTSAVSPWLCAPWPTALEDGFVHTEVRGNTLRELLVELSDQYKQTNINFELIDPKTNDPYFFCDVFVNDRNFSTFHRRLDERLKEGDRVRIEMFWLFDG